MRAALTQNWNSESGLEREIGQNQSFTDRHKGDMLSIWRPKYFLGLIFFKGSFVTPLSGAHTIFVVNGTGLQIVSNADPDLGNE